MTLLTGDAAQRAAQLHAERQREKEQRIIKFMGALGDYVSAKIAYASPGADVYDSIASTNRENELQEALLALLS